MDYQALLHHWQRAHSTEESDRVDAPDTAFMEARWAALERQGVKVIH